MAEAGHVVQMAPTGAIDTSYFANKARKDLLSLLEGVPGKKNIVLQRALVGPIELLVRVSTLQEYGVDRIFVLENNNVESAHRNVVFITRGEKPKEVQAVASQIKRLQRGGRADYDFSVFWVPRRTQTLESVLGDEGVLGDVTSHELPLLLQPLAEDVLSMELDDAFSDLYLRKDPTSIFLSAKALLSLEQRYGLFPRILGKGDNARRLADLLLRMRSELAQDKSYVSTGVPTVGMTPSDTIDSLIILDRDIDLATPLMTQLTYEGLLDEIFGIKNSHIEVDPSIAGQPPAEPTSSSSSSANAPNQKRKIKLDGAADSLYATLRDANFAAVGGHLNRVARRLQTDTDKQHRNMTTSELREFVSKLSGFQTERSSVAIHTAFAEEVLKTSRAPHFRAALEIQQSLIGGNDPLAQHDSIEDLIARTAPLPAVLRLLCLESVLSGGLRPKDFDAFRRQLLHAYGFEHLLTLDALEKMGLLTQRSATTFSLSSSSSTTTAPRTNYSSLRRPLSLILDDISEDTPTDVAYTYSGYAPLSTRIVQTVLQKSYLHSLTSTRINLPGNAAANGDGFKGFEDALASVKGRTTDEVQTGTDRASRSKGALAGRNAPRTTLVFFLGGVTFAEVSALRFVAGQDESRRILVATTGMVSGARMVEAAIATAAT